MTPGRTLALVLCTLGSGCAHSDRDRAWVVEALHSRNVGQVARAHASTRTGDPLFEDGLSADEAVAIALAHNPTYQADLSRIDSARADLTEARRPVNPQLTLLDAVGPVSAMATLLAPLESLWQLPLRSKLAVRALESVAESLVQGGLDLARDVKLAHAACALAEQRLVIRRALSAIWRQLGQLSQQRVDLGEAAVSEALSVAAEAALADDLSAAAQNDRTLARAALRTLLGFDRAAPTFAIESSPSSAELPPLSTLATTARMARPDVRAAELSLLAAGARLGWERARVLAVAAQVEGHWTRPDTFASRLGARIELPIFGANPGGRGRAQAELQRASAALTALRQRVLLDLTQAYVSAAQGRASLARERTSVLPALESARALATQSYELGEESYVVVLDLMRRSSEARLREAELVAAVRRSDAELERAVGARLGETP
jgi:cobalt-zinc-cadmium efflux system outer membrane protein